MAHIDFGGGRLRLKNTDPAGGLSGRPDETTDATAHVHDAGSGEVHVARTNVVQPAGARPRPGHDQNGV